MNFLEESLIVEFQCPICLKYMFPPIRQCLNGHCFCTYCFEGLQRCTVCRAPKSKARPNDLEKMHSLLTFPCRYQPEGCSYMGKGEVIERHQNDCKYSNILCPLRYNQCDWCGKKPELVPHCIKNHSSNTFFSENQQLVVTNFVNIMDRKYYLIFKVFNNLFRCTWDLSKDTRIMRYALYYLEKPIKDKNYFFEVNILYFNKPIISMKGPCGYLKNEEDMFMDKFYLMLNYDIVKKFCDKQGSLNYTVKIGPM